MLQRTSGGSQSFRFVICPELHWNSSRRGAPDLKAPCSEVQKYLLQAAKEVSIGFAEVELNSEKIEAGVIWDD